MSPDRKPLGTLDAIGLVVGIIIGAGIFEAPATVFGSVHHLGEGLLLWLGGAIIALCGALCYAELAATYVTDAGEAEYFTRAFGRFAGWYFTWIQLVCFRTAAAIVSIAYIFGEYAQQIYDAPRWMYVGGAIVVLSGINALGLQPGKWTQNLLAAVKVIALGGIVVIGFCYSSPDPLNVPHPTRSLASAVVLIMYAYSGWHEAAYIVGDMRQPERSLPRALVVGVLLVAVVYLAVNLAAVSAFGPALVQPGFKFGVELFKLGGLKGSWFALMVVMITLGSTNGTILSGSRLFGTVGTMQPGFGWLGRGRTSRDAPLMALAIQAIICLAFVTVIEIAVGSNGFEVIVAATSPVLWLVFLGAGLALLRLRWVEPSMTRPFRVPMYPIVPIIYVVACIFMLFESSLYAVTTFNATCSLMIALLALGIPYWFLVHNRQPSLD